MSVFFYINNKNDLPVMTVGECLNISSKEISQFSFDENHEDFNADNFYHSLISEYESLVLAEYGVSARGFELGFNKETNNYEIKVLTPSTRNDWLLALSYISDLAKHLGQDSIFNDIDNVLYNSDTIYNFDYERDILFGIQSIEKPNALHNESFLFCLIRPVVINDKIYDDIFSDNNPIDKFSEFITNIQYLNAYSAIQTICQDNKTKKIIGLYVLAQDTNTILPFEPFLDFKYRDMLKDDDISCWNIRPIVFNGKNPEDGYEFVGEISYQDFIQKLPKEKYQWIDAKYILVEGLSKQEILDLI